MYGREKGQMCTKTLLHGGTFFHVRKKYLYTKTITKKLNEKLYKKMYRPIVRVRDNSKKNLIKPIEKNKKKINKVRKIKLPTEGKGEQ